MNRFLTVLKIETKLAMRCPDSIIFGIGMPIGIMVLIGIIAGEKSVFDGADYTFLQSAFGALIAVGICATAFMGLPLTIVDYRDKKILKHFFATPASPKMILSIQVFINIFISIISALLVATVAIVLFDYKMEGYLIKFIGAYFLVMISMYSIGMLVASVCKSIKIANVVCSIIYFPMLFLSGATIPYELFPKALQNVSNILPLTHGVKLLKGFSMGWHIDNLYLSIIIMIVIIIVGFGLSFKLFRWE